MLEYDRIDINEGIDVTKGIDVTMLVKNVGYVIIGILLIKILIIKKKCVMVVMTCL